MQKIKHFALLVAEFFYCGRFPYAPGTAGSLGSLIIWVPCLYAQVPYYVLIALLVGLFFVGGWASGHGIAHYGVTDPKQVVIDEVVGQGIPFLILAPRLSDILIAFLLFRFFDILKPWPIRAIERFYKNKWGIMIDDVIAGIFALLIIYIWRIYL